MIKRVTAVEFNQAFLSGHSRPCLFHCLDDAPRDFDVVTKFRSTIHAGRQGLMNEALASLVGRHLGLNIPEPFLVAVDGVPSEGVNSPEVRDQICASAGINFGSRFVGGQVTTVPQYFRLNENQCQTAEDIFFFDAIIQQPDRHQAKPNLLMRGNDLFPIDHELALGFLWGGFGTSPLNENEVGYLRSHVFFDFLRKQRSRLHAGRLRGRLDLLDEALVERFFSSLPNEWRSDALALGRLQSYFREVRTRFDAVVRNLNLLLQ